MIFFFTSPTLRKLALSAEICFVFISSHLCWVGSMKNACWLSLAHSQVWCIINIPAFTTLTIFLGWRLLYAANYSIPHFQHRQSAHILPFRVSRQVWTHAHHVPQTERDIYESFCVGLPEPIAYLEVRGWCLFILNHMGQMSQNVSSFLFPNFNPFIPSNMVRSIKAVWGGAINFMNSS